MPRNISFALTINQFYDGSKDVTRRLGWKNLQPGEILCAVEKSQGIPKDGKIRKLGLIRVVSARRERLSRMTGDPSWGEIEVRREGFPNMTPAEFVEFFCATHKGCSPSTYVTRIEFERIAE